LFSNRNINEKHLSALKKAFVEHGNITKVQPILVNESFEIIDGQHRFMVAQDLHLPVYYTMVPGLNISDARQMNLLHKLWNLDDYIHTYAKQGNENYIKYQQLREDYPHLSHTAIIGFSTYGDPKGAFKNVRKGDYILVDEEEVRAELDKLDEILGLVNFQPNRDFLYAIRRIMRSDVYDHSRMVQKLRLFSDSLKRQGNMEDMMRALEEVYNFKTHEGNRVRLF
jgi:hypothetical protein